MFGGASKSPQDERLEWVKADIRELCQLLKPPATDNRASSSGANGNGGNQYPKLSFVSGQLSEKSPLPSFLQSKAPPVSSSASWLEKDERTEIEIALRRHPSSKDPKENMQSMIALMEMWEEIFCKGLSAVVEEHGVCIPRPGTAAAASSTAKSPGDLSRELFPAETNRNRVPLMIRGPTYHQQQIDIPGGASYTETYSQGPSASEVMKLVSMPPLGSNGSSSRATTPTSSLSLPKLVLHTKHRSDALKVFLAFAAEFRHVKAKCAEQALLLDSEVARNGAQELEIRRKDETLAAVKKQLEHVSQECADMQTRNVALQAALEMERGRVDGNGSGSDVDGNDPGHATAAAVARLQEELTFSEKECKELKTLLAGLQESAEGMELNGKAVVAELSDAQAEVSSLKKLLKTPQYEIMSSSAHPFLSSPSAAEAFPPSSAGGDVQAELDRERAVSREWQNKFEEKQRQWLEVDEELQSQGETLKVLQEQIKRLLDSKKTAAAALAASALVSSITTTPTDTPPSTHKDKDKEGSDSGIGTESGGAKPMKDASSLYKDVKFLKGELKIWREKAATLTEDLEYERKSVADMEEARRKEKEKNKNSRSDVQQMVARVKAAEKDVNDLKKERDQLVEKLKDVKKEKKKEKDLLHEELSREKKGGAYEMRVLEADLRTEIATLQEKLQKQRERQQEWDTKSFQERESRLKLERLNSHLQEQVKKLMEELRAMESANKRGKNAVYEAETAKEQAETAARDVNVQYLAAQNKVNRLMKQLRAWQDREGDINADAARLKAIMKEVEDLRKSVLAKEDRIAHLLGIINSQLAQIAEHVGTIEDLKSALEALKNMRHHDSSAHVKKLALLEQEVARLTALVSDQTSQLSTLQTMVSTVEAAKADEVLRNHTLSAELTQTLQERLSWTEKYQDLAGRVETLERLLADGQRDLAEKGKTINVHAVLLAEKDTTLREKAREMKEQVQKIDEQAQEIATLGENLRCVEEQLAVTQGMKQDGLEGLHAERKLRIAAEEAGVTLLRDLAACDNARVDLERSVSAQRTALDAMHAQVRLSEDALTVATADVATARAEANAMRDELIAQIHTLNERFRTLEAANAAKIMAVQAAAEADIASARHVIDVKEEALVGKKQIISALETELESVRVIRTQVLTDHAALETKYAAMVQQHVTLTTQYEELLSKYKAFAENQGGLDRRYTELVAKHSVLEGKYAETVDKHGALEKRNAAIDSELHLLKGQLEDWQTRFSEAKLTLAHLADMKKKEEQDWAEKQQKFLVEIERLREDILLERRGQEEQREAFKRIMQEVEKLHGTLVNLEKENKQVSVENDDLKKQLISLKKELLLSQNHRNELKHQSMVLEQQIAKLLAELEHGKAAASVKDENSSYIQRIQVLMSEIHLRTNDLEESKVTLHKSEQLVLRLKDDAMMKERSHTLEVKRLEDTVDLLKEKVQILERQLHTLACAGKENQNNRSGGGGGSSNNSTDGDDMNALKLQIKKHQETIKELFARGRDAELQTVHYINEYNGLQEICKKLNEQNEMLKQQLVRPPK